jgi:energy-coupling factor transport system substrate-specific component
MASSVRGYKNVLLPAAGAILAGGLLNALMGMGNIAIKSPFFFDSIFTAACGAVFGPAAGALCGLTTHLWLEALHGWDGTWIPFVVCNIATGLIVGFMARGRRLNVILNVLLCAFLVAMANAVLGGMVDFYFFRGVTTHPSDYLVTGLLLAGQSLFSAAFWARIPLNLIDKGIAVSLAFLAKRYYDRRASAR